MATNDEWFRLALTASCSGLEQQLTSATEIVRTIGTWSLENETEVSVSVSNQIV